MLKPFCLVDGGYNAIGHAGARVGSAACEFRLPMERIGELIELRGFSKFTVMINFYAGENTLWCARQHQSLECPSDSPMIR